MREMIQFDDCACFLRLGGKKTPTSQPFEELSLLFCLPCDIGGAIMVARDDVFSY